MNGTRPAQVVEDGVCLTLYLSVSNSMEYIPDGVHHAVCTLCTFLSSVGPLWHGDMVTHCAYTQRLFAQSLCQSVQHLSLIHI